MIKNINITVFLILCIPLHAGINDYIYPHQDPSYSNYGTLGLIQMPSARFHEEGTLAFNWIKSEPYVRGSILAYPFEWMEASYQYTDINNTLYSDVQSFSGNQTYKDKGFDIKIRLVKESQFLPSIAIGARDIAGTNIFEAEYIAASKLIGNFDFTVGLGWGVLSQDKFYNPLAYIADEFEVRTTNTDTQGGEVSLGKIFSGSVGIFAGVEYYLPNLYGARLKLEYDSTDYTKEGFPFGRDSFIFSFKPVKQSDSRFNFGIVYPMNDSISFNASFIKGNTVSFGVALKGSWGPKDPVIPKNDPAQRVPNSEVVKEITGREDEYLYRAALLYLRENNIFLQNAAVDNDQLTVAYSQSKYPSTIMAVGRASNVLDEITPEHIKSFKLVHLNANMALSSVTVSRDAYVRNKDFNLYQVASQSIEIESAKFIKDDYKYNPRNDFPRAFWKLAPTIRSQIGGPDGFYFGDLRLAFNAEILFSKNIALVSQLSAGIYDNFDELKLKSDSILPHVRTDIVDYLKNTRSFGVKRAQLNMFNNPIPNVYTKLSAGILEEMFGGIGGEVLYRNFDSNYAIGMELWKVKQRDFRIPFRFRSYETTTGFVNFYYTEPVSKITLLVKGGRFLAEDSGFNFDFSRRFASGLRIGAFFSLTDISEAEFGEGSFDKGFYFHIPLNIFSPQHTKAMSGFGLRPLTRDGAAILNHAYNLYGVTEPGQGLNLERDWSDLYE